MPKSYRRVSVAAKKGASLAVETEPVVGLRSGLEVGRDFFLCFSPERVDPGNPKFQTRNIPKVVGGITPACTESPQ